MENKVALVIGGSRGIGRQVCIDLARNGYAVVVSGKSLSDASVVRPFPPDPNSSQSTASTVTREITEAGGTALALVVDTRNPDSIDALFASTWKHFGRLDAVIYNAGAIWWASVAKTPMRRFQLMQQVNVEGLYASVQTSLPYFERGGWRGRIIVVSPPIYSRFFRGKTAYAMGKVGMSVLTKGLAMDWQREGKHDMAITSIWPASSIESAATLAANNDPEQRQDLRHPAIFSDAILAMLAAPTATVNGLLDTDEDFLRNHAGVTDFSRYSLVPGTSPRRIMPAAFPSLEVAEQADEGKRMDSTLIPRRAAKL
ncbi:putative Hydroxysteroid dehydrogenase-like protein 2 [Mycena venus]|uniref:Putative Hydroxysteroid dehydrogenase-like protein 2 n=1 Tax=Mycena venus TaxID=2733690 RepID=A0A8H6XSJ4_9AGAR|nr:putative Hydroxysteroid dehydrogenase-like protein 2 [Mycena venus]